MSLAADNQTIEEVAPARAWLGVERRGAARAELTVERVEPLAWDAMAADFDGVVQEQLYLYAETRWPSTEAEALVFRCGEEVVGGTLILIQRLPLRLAAIAVCKWGPVLKDNGRPDAELIYGGMIDALVREYAVRRGMMLSVLPRAFPGPANWQFEHLMARGFRRGSGLLFPNRYIVRLGLDETAQRKSFGQKWRYHLGKAEKAGLTFERGEPSQIREFDALYAAMSDRKNFPDHSAYETIDPLLAAECGRLRPELFFVRHGGEIVAGAVVFKAGDTAVYLFGATNDCALPLRAGYFMHDRIIRWLTENTDAKWYDLGGTDGFQGLHQFKKGMVGSAGVISQVPPAANTAARPLPLLIGTTAFAARDGYHHLRRAIESRFGGKARPDQKRSGQKASEIDRSAAGEA